jgi:hypothetical protein
LRYRPPRGVTYSDRYLEESNDLGAGKVTQCLLGMSKKPDAPHREWK